MLWPDLTSNLSIPAGDNFVFAGGQREAFTAFATNQGDVPVTIVEDVDGARRAVAVVPPGAQASYRFDPRAAALFQNPSDQTASMKVEVWGPTQVGMRYTKIGE
jgi:hypothetical protein